VATRTDASHATACIWLAGRMTSLSSYIWLAGRMHDVSLASMGWEWPGAREREELGHRTSTSMEHQHGVFGGGTHIVLAIRRAGAAHVHT